jgi:hypothetical protein
VAFDLQVLLEEASARSGGLQDFGDDSFRPALAVLLRALDAEGGLSDAGRERLHARILERLQNRLGLEDYCRRYPEILDEELDDPIVIVGLPRTGTTLLQRILGCDPRLYPMLYWETRYPIPLSDPVPPGPDPRLALAKTEVAAMIAANPTLLAIHPWDAEAADEEGMLIEHSFHGYFDAYADVPSYSEWLWQADQVPAYQHLKRMLKFIQWQKRRRGSSALRWVLKAPHHLRQIDVLFKVFPGAQVIQTHRDPLETVPSSGSFIHNLRRVYMPDADPVRAGQQRSAIYARGMLETLHYRDRNPAAPFLDVWFADTVNRPLEVVRAIYAYVGLELPADVEERMRAHLEHNRRELRPPHSYSMEHFGLSEQQIRRDFAAYRARYILPRELRVLADIEAIQRLKHAYFRCVDTASLAELRTLLHEDVVVHFVGGSYETVVRGREQYLELIAGLVNNQMIAQHTGHHPEIDVTSETEATGTWYLHGHFYRLWDMHHVSGTALYRDRYIKEDGRWQIIESRYESLCEIDELMEQGPRVTAHYLGKVGRARQSE